MIALSACQTKNTRPQQSHSNPEEDFFELLDPNTKTLQQAQNNAARAKKEGNTDRALFYYVKILQLDPQNISAMQEMAAIYQQQNHHDLAGKIYADILTLDPTHPLANEFIGLKKLKERQIDEAKQLLNQAIQHNSNLWESHNGLGIIADLQQNYTLALEHYQSALQIKPGNAMLLNNIGYSYYLKGKENQARDYFYRALKINEKYQRAIFNLALLEVKNQDLISAVSLLSRILPIYEAYNNVGYLCMKNGQYEEAETYFKNAIQSSPYYFPQAQQNLKRIAKLKAESIPAIKPKPATTSQTIPPPQPTVLTQPAIPKKVISKPIASTIQKTPDLAAKPLEVPDQPEEPQKDVVAVQQAASDKAIASKSETQAPKSISTDIETQKTPDLPAKPIEDSDQTQKPQKTVVSDPPTASDQAIASKLEIQTATSVSTGIESKPDQPPATTQTINTTTSEPSKVISTETESASIDKEEFVNTAESSDESEENIVQTTPSIEIGSENLPCGDDTKPCSVNSVSDIPVLQPTTPSIFDQPSQPAVSVPLIQSTDEILQNLKTKMNQDYDPLPIDDFPLTTPP